MSVALAIHAVGSMGFFPSRAFMPALATAALMRWGDRVPLIRDSSFMRLIEGLEGSWLTHDVTIIVLAVLTLLELMATRSPEMRELMTAFDGYLKAAVAGLVSIGLLTAADAATLEAIREAGIGDYLLPAFVAAGTYALSRVRGGVVEHINEADPEDDTGLHRLLFWLENFFVIFGLLVLVFYPLFMITVLAAAFAALWLIKRRMDRAEEKLKVPCAGCGTAIFRHALRCPSCRLPVENPSAVGWFGTGSQRPADKERQPLLLVQWLRCPACAGALKLRQPKQVCPTCGERVNEDPAFIRSYVSMIQGRLPRVMLVAFLLGLVPVIGAVFGIVYYRIQLVMPYRRYIPPWHSFVSRMLIKVVFVLLLLLQIVPLIGAAAIPLMAWISSTVHRKAYCRAQGSEKYCLPTAQAAV
jgi:hypothetical protein